MLLWKDKQLIIQKLYKRKVPMYFCSHNNGQLLQMLFYFYFKESKFFFLFISKLNLWFVYYSQSSNGYAEFEAIDKDMNNALGKLYLMIK